MLHRALFGSYERFIGILLEDTAGELPVWLTPTQAIVLPIADRHVDRRRRGRATQLRADGVRVEVDERTESVGRKIRDAELRKIPFMLVVGDREAEDGTVAVREHRKGDTGIGGGASEFTRLYSPRLDDASDHTKCRSLEGSTGARPSGTRPGSTNASGCPRCG